MKTLEELFEQYLDQVSLLDQLDKTSTQYVEMRRAFFAGAGTLMKLMLDDQMTGEEVSEDEGAVILDRVFQEISNFWNKEITNHTNKHKSN